MQETFCSFWNELAQSYYMRHPSIRLDLWRDCGTLSDAPPAPTRLCSSAAAWAGHTSFGSVSLSFFEVFFVFFELGTVFETSLRKATSVTVTRTVSL